MLIMYPFDGLQLSQVIALHFFAICILLPSRVSGAIQISFVCARLKGKRLLMKGKRITTNLRINLLHFVDSASLRVEEIRANSKGIQKVIYRIFARF